MRVVAGELRGRRILAPAGTSTRPTSDRVREAIFNMLVSAGRVDDARVLDLFAGSGALGIEALSRGAAQVTFVERDRAALDALRANLDALGIGRDRATVVVGDALVHASSGSYDLALLDPPYAFAGWSDLLGVIDAAVAVCESGGAVTLPDGWRIIREKAYGGTVVTIAEHVAPAPTTGAPR